MVSVLNVNIDQYNGGYQNSEDYDHHRNKARLITLKLLHLSYYCNAPAYKHNQLTNIRFFWL